MVKAKLFESSSSEASEPKTEQNYEKTSWLSLQCSGSAQIPSQDNLNDSHQFLSLFQLKRSERGSGLIIFDTEYFYKEAMFFNIKLSLDGSTCITQLPNGELFCYGNYSSGITLIIDRNYGVRRLPSGTNCHNSSALYFENNIYCFGGFYKNSLALSSKFDLKKNRWINLARLPKVDRYCHSVIFNGNILISGNHCKNLWLYSIKINSFSIIPYNFWGGRKLLMNVGRLYLFEWYDYKLIYESEDGYHWNPISETGSIDDDLYGMYCLYNKGKIYISSECQYFQFDLKERALFEIKNSNIDY